MAYVDLSRNFVAISKDAEPDLTLGELWGRKYGGWLKWSDLLERPRVVLLAEASSGKTDEFKNTAAALRASGSPAFFVPIEQLSQGPMEGALGPEATLFATWKLGSSTAWFFLDSVDEARLVHKEFDAALRRLAGELGSAVGRARVLVSCRVSDWRGRTDRESIQQILPLSLGTAVEQSTQDDAALLDPVFDRKEHRKPTDKENDKEKHELLVVQLTPLDDDQRRLLAASAGVRDADEFVEAVERHGLDALAERPGDVLDLALYWNLHGRFGSLAEMTDHGIQTKLAELNKYRPDNSELALQQARQGAERIAAALTLGKSFTVLAPGYEPDPTYSAGALDPEAILKEWTDAKRNALLRRGAFAPATYGRIRFHHRSTQEFLTAAWLNRLMKAGLPRQALFNLLFAERYGVKTIVPSLRPVAAWLAQDHADVRDEAIRREPFVLLNYGDAGSLPLPIKRKLLLHLARRHAEGETAHNNIERRALWMFASPDLADTIREAWEINPRSDFRADLVRLIGEGHITACIDLAASVAESDTEPPYYRILGLQALKECGAHSALKKVADSLLEDPSRLSPRLYSGFIEVLFPEYVSVAQFLLSLESAQMPSPLSSHGISYSISEMWNECPVAARPEFIAGLADLCLREPYVNNFERVSKKYDELAKHIAPIAIGAMKDPGDREPSDSLIRLLSVVERADHGHQVDERDTPLRGLVRQNSKVKRALFWHDVADQRAHRRDNQLEVVSVWQIYFGGKRLWELSTHDLPWLYADLSERSEENDRRIALSAILSIHSQDGTLSENVAALRKRIGTPSVLQADIDSFLVPPVEDEESISETKRQAAEQRGKREADQKSWIDLRRDLQVTPSVLYDPLGVLKGKGLNGLIDLTNWLQFKTRKDYEGAARQWPLLQEGFGLPVAHAYRDGMKTLWRAAKPEAPKREPGSPVTTKWTTVLAFAGVGIEADQDRAWAAKLKPSEALRAAEHGCISDQGYPDWIDALLEHHESIVLPVVTTAFLTEWKSEEHGSLNFLHHYGHLLSSIPSSVRAEVFRIISRREPKRHLVLDLGLRMLSRLRLTPAERQALQKLAKTRLKKHAASRPDRTDRYLAMLFLVNPSEGVGQLAALLAQTSSEDRKEIAERMLGSLFGERQPLVPISLLGAPVHALEALALLAYKEVRPEDDNVHQEGTYSPNTRDEAESGRGAVLRGLLDATGEEAYKAVLRLANSPEVKPRRLRFLELAHSVAERDAEIEPWHPDDVVSFEGRHILPIRTAAGLYGVILGVLDEVTWSFEHSDASSRAILESARDEDAVQNWLAEQLVLRANARYHVHRETEVASGNLPDITVASTTSAFEVAIEAKHGAKHWTAKTLEGALRNQLAEDYLKPTIRRHGILVVTNHRGRTWHHPKIKQRMSFTQLIAHLRSIASGLKINTVGDISVDVRGIDASPRAKKRNGTTSKRMRRTKRKGGKAAARSVGSKNALCR